MILISLYSEKYGVAASCRERSLDAVEHVSLQLLPFPSCITVCELTKGFSDGGEVPDEMGAVLAMPRREHSSSRVLKCFNFLRGGGKTISRAEHIHEDLDAWLVELAFCQIDGEDGLVFILVSAINHDVVINISYSRNIGYQQLDGMLENLCGGVDSKTESLILVQSHVHGECTDVST